MQENVFFWRFLMVSRSKSSWSPPTFQRFGPEFSQQSTKSRTFQFQIVFFPWETNATKFFQSEISFSSVYRFPIEFQLQQFGILLKIFGWCIYMFLNHQNRNNAFTEFSFLQSSTYRSCQLTHIVHLHVIRDFPQFCSFTMAELRWKWVWCVKNCLDDQESIL